MDTQVAWKMYTEQCIAALKHHLGFVWLYPSWHRGITSSWSLVEEHSQIKTVCGIQMGVIACCCVWMVCFHNGHLSKFVGHDEPFSDSDSFPGRQRFEQHLLLYLKKKINNRDKVRDERDQGHWDQRHTRVRESPAAHHDVGGIHNYMWEPTMINYILYLYFDSLMA